MELVVEAEDVPGDPDTEVVRGPPGGTGGDPCDQHLDRLPDDDDPEEDEREPAQLPASLPRPPGRRPVTRPSGDQGAERDPASDRRPEHVHERASGGSSLGHADHAPSPASAQHRGFRAGASGGGSGVASGHSASPRSDEASRFNDRTHSFDRTEQP
jgi:hypothetical protein